MRSLRLRVVIGECEDYVRLYSNEFYITQDHVYFNDFKTCSQLMNDFRYYVSREEALIEEGFEKNRYCLIEAYYQTNCLARWRKEIYDKQRQKQDDPDYTA